MNSTGVGTGALFICLIASLACSRADVADPAAVSQTESYPVLNAEERQRIGSVDDPQTALTAFGDLEVADDGRIFTVHRQERSVRVHAPDGTPLWSFGGDGEGPGEFRNPSALDLFDDEVAVLDTRLSRASYFDLEGEFLRSVPYRPPPVEDPRWSQVRANGLLADETFHSAPRRMTGPGWEALTHAPLLRLAGDGSTLDTIVHYSLDQLLVLESGETPVVAIQPFPGSQVWSLSGRRMELVMIDRHMGPHTRFRVTKLAIGADTLWSRDYGFEPVAYDQAVIDSFITGFPDMFIERSGASRGAVEAELRDKVSRPAHLPVAARVNIGHDGSVWIELSDRDPVSTRWLVLQADGQVAGKVTLPQPFRWGDATEREVWGMERDELDVPYIVKYELSSSG